MGHFITNTEQEQLQMLREIGYKDYNDLFAHIPQGVKLKGELNIPEGMSEMEVNARLEEMADKNKVYKHIFRGAGAYNHYIPAIVTSVVTKEDFVTAYTPYQAEISQGNLQSIFEYQTMICELTGLDASNASVYDGATAAAESVFMCKDRRRSRVLVSAATNPEVIETMKTYCNGRDTAVEIIPIKEGVTDIDALKAMLDETVACVYIQQPNYFGIVEDADSLVVAIHEKGAKAIMGVNPISLAIVKTPAEVGADIAVGEGQPLGMPMGFGGPYLGFMAATKDMMRKLPGRIVGETVDHDGRRSFVLTLQAREQHIRREKASSNICSNEALCALTASVYMSAMGPKGMKQVAASCVANAHYLQEELAKAGLKPTYNKAFFHEFVTDCPVDNTKLDQALAEAGMLGGLPLEDGKILWCATEMNTKKEIDDLVSYVREVCNQ